MSELTTFAALTALLTGEPLDELFLRQNIWTIDRLLRIGAVTHRHDGHAAIANPPQDDGTGPVIEIDPLGGTIAADLAIYVGYTWVDADGGETIISDTSLVSTGSGLEAPTTAPTATLDHLAGGLMADTYTYGLTVSDGLGGETPLGSTVQVTVPPGFANSEIVLSDLDTILTETGGTEWRLYRAKGAGAFTYLTSGSGASVTDDNSLCPHCDEQPPPVGTTANTNLLRVTLPAAAWPTGVASLRLYASIDGSFAGASLLGEYLPADAGTVKEFTALAFQDGRPPAVNLSIPGADLIDPDTELLEFPWKRPVANAAALPMVGNTAGDVRETLDDHALHTWDGAAWVDLAGGGGGGATSVPLDTHVPIWQKAGVDVAWLYAHEVTSEDLIVNALFDGAAATLGDGYAIDGAGNAIPEAGANDTNAIHYLPFTPAWEILYDGYVERTFTVASNNWSRIGVTLGDARTGLFAWIERVSGNLVIATRTVDSNLESDFTVLITDALPAAPAIADTYSIQLDRVGNHLHATVHQGKAVVAEAEIDIPAPLRADFGDGVGLQAGMADRWTNPDAWTTDHVFGVWHHHRRQLWATSLKDDGGTGDVMLSNGDGEQWFNLSSMLTPYAAGWADLAGVEATAVLMPDGWVQIFGRSVKSSGAAPVAGDIIATLDPRLAPLTEVLQPVVTGDDTVESVGMVRINAGGQITWVAGTSSAPATDHPYVCYDGIRFRGNN
jgi:hypothetical protein